MDKKELSGLAPHPPKTAIGYHGAKRGMVFQEVNGKKRRLVLVATSLYHVCGQWASPRGKINHLQVARKQICNPSRWVLLAASEPFADSAEGEKP